MQFFRRPFKDRTLADIPTDAWIHEGGNGENLGKKPKLSVDPVPYDFYIEVQKGNVPGHSIVSVNAENQAASTTSEDLSFAGLTLIYPVSAESLELVSENVNDTAGGSGCTEVTIRYLDTSYTEQQVTVATNGGTITTGITDFFRPIGSGLIASAWGATLENEGNIQLRISGGGNLMLTMPAGDNKSLDCYLSIPAGKIGFFVYVFSSVSKNNDAAFKFKTRLENGGFLTIFNLSNVSASSEISLPVSSQQIPAKTDIKITLVSSNNSHASVAYQVLLVDEDLVNQGSI